MNNGAPSSDDTEHYLLAESHPAQSINYDVSDLEPWNSTPTSTNQSKSSDKFSYRRVLALTAVCAIITSTIIVIVSYGARLPLAKLVLQPASDTLVLPNITQTVDQSFVSHNQPINQQSTQSINQQSTEPTITSVHSFESFSEHPHGYWTDGNNTGTHFVGFGEHEDRYEPLIDLLIGKQCGGYDGLNYTDLSSLEFLRNQSILMLSDSTDRYMVQYLCGRPHCVPKCPKPCEYTKNALGAQFSHYKYPNITHGSWVLSGVFQCHLPHLNFTISSAMTYGIVPNRFLTHTYFKYNFTQHRLLSDPVDEPYTYRHFIHQHVKPAIQAFVPSPSIIIAQSGLWDLMLLQHEMRKSIRNCEITLKTSWWHEFGTNMLPTIDELFPHAKLKYLRTIPPVKDYDNRLCSLISTMVRFKVQDLRTSQPQSAWRLWDTALMLAEQEKLAFDEHHYEYNVMNQLLNVLLNDIKARRTMLHS